MHQTKPPTHNLWLQKWEGGRFREWLQVGKGRIDTDENGNSSAHNFQDLTAIGGWSGYTCLLPIGIRPKDPEAKPQRPSLTSDVSDEEEDS
jgi:hypothetical protein